MRRHISMDTSGSTSAMARTRKRTGRRRVISFRAPPRRTIQYPVHPRRREIIPSGHPKGRLAYSDVELLAPYGNTIVTVSNCVFRDGESDVPRKLLKPPQSDPILTNPLSGSEPVGSRRNSSHPRETRKVSVDVNLEGPDGIVAAVQREEVAAVVA